MFTLDAGKSRIFEVNARLKQAADDSNYEADVEVTDVESPIDGTGVILAIENPEGH